MLFTTSWDDGYALDLRVADLLDRFGCTGTFYVCPAAQHQKKMLTEEEIRALAKRHEIGAHTLTHPRLSRIPLEKAREELEGSKAWVEKVTGSPCEMFCYPKGDTNADMQTLVREAGYKGARTVDQFCFSAENQFALPVSLQIGPYPFRQNWKPSWKILDPLGPLRFHASHLRAFGIPLIAWRGWLPMACAVLDHAQATNQPFFHLYGHSSEVERYGLWKELEAFLSYVSQKKDIEHVRNVVIASTVASS